MSFRATASTIVHKFWGYIIPAAVALLAPLKAVLISTVVVVAADLVLGVWAALKRGEALTSRKFRRTIVKIAIYESAIVLAWVVSHYMMDDLFPLARVCSVAIGMVELKSCLENMSTISGQDVLRAVIDKLNGTDVKA
jgi:hypothetical protein